MEWIGGGRLLVVYKIRKMWNFKANEFHYLSHIKGSMVGIAYIKKQNPKRSPN